MRVSYQKSTERGCVVSTWVIIAVVVGDSLCLLYKGDYCLAVITLLSPVLVVLPIAIVLWLLGLWSGDDERKGKTESEERHYEKEQA